MEDLLQKLKLLVTSICLVGCCQALPAISDKIQPNKGLDNKKNFITQHCRRNEIARS